LHFIIYCFFRILGFCISLLSYQSIHQLGRFAGGCAFYLHRSFRKKAMTNLTIAFGSTCDEMELKKIAKKSFQNLMITLLEFFRLKKSQSNLGEIVILQENPQIESLLKNNQGVIFLSAHQANWEISFIALTQRYKGIAIGKPIKNRRLYRWILSVREMFGGKIVTPKNAIRESIKALSKGEFLGIVGDQAYPESPYAYPLFGTRAWTASTPALLAYKTGCPLIAGTTQRIDGKYHVCGSDPIWPNLNLPMKEEVPRMMDRAMRHLEASIAQKPEQWMWIHDRWKQQGIDHVKRKFRFGFILVIFPKDPTPFLEILPLFRAIYPRSFLTFFVPKGTEINLENCQVKEYENENDLMLRDWRYQLVLDFYGSKSLRHHYLKLGAFKALHLGNFKKNYPLADALKQKLVKSECLKTVTF
jgi:Kdo2-lipid IVA lauroyltransferase/acyltransferase